MAVLDVIFQPGTLLEGYEPTGWPEVGITGAHTLTFPNATMYIVSGDNYTIHGKGGRELDIPMALIQRIEVDGQHVWP
jgi:hypothetical protein